MVFQIDLRVLGRWPSLVVAAGEVGVQVLMVGLSDRYSNDPGSVPGPSSWP